MKSSQLSSHQDSIATAPKPKGSKVILLRNRQQGFIYVEIPPPGWTWGLVFQILSVLLWLSAPTALFAFFFLQCVANPSLVSRILLVPIAIVSFVFLWLGFEFLVQVISKHYTRQILHIGRQAYGVWTERGFSKTDTEEDVCGEDPEPSRRLGATRKLNLAALIPAREENNTDGVTTIGPYIEVREGTKAKKFGQGLQLMELEWIHKEVNETIQEPTLSKVAEIMA